MMFVKYSTTVLHSPQLPCTNLPKNYYRYSQSSSTPTAVPIVRVMLMRTTLSGVRIHSWTQSASANSVCQPVLYPKDLLIFYQQLTILSKIFIQNFWCIKFCWYQAALCMLLHFCYIIISNRVSHFVILVTLYPSNSIWPHNELWFG